MSKWRKKPVVIEAHRWWHNGDHPLDQVDTGSGTEGKLVRRFRRPEPEYRGDSLCNVCGHRLHCHGWIDTLEGGHIVCPGDWIITGIQGEHYPCKPDIFAATYESVGEGGRTAA